MEYRVENKYLVTDAQLALLAGRLKPVMPQDVHQSGNCYEIRSLYFDDIRDRCMDENEAGYDQRRKYRIRIYDPDAASAKLEIKEKLAGKTKKISCGITRSEALGLMENSLPLLMDSRAPLNLFQLSARCTKMEPKAMIYYERTAFVYPVGNVRITFDRNIMASRNPEDFFCPHPQSLVPVLPTGLHVLEVKYDEFLPKFLFDRLEIEDLTPCAFSKYYLGRLAIRGEFPIHL